jgi:hypothetical protein
LTVAEVERTDVVCIAIKVDVAAVVILVEDAVVVAARVFCACVEIVACVLLNTPLRLVAFGSGAGVVVIFADDIFVDARISVRVTGLDGASVTVVAIDGGMLTTRVTFAEVLSTRCRVVADGDDRFASTFYEASVFGACVTVVTVETWIEAAACFLVALVLGTVVFVAAILLLA